MLTLVLFLVFTVFRSSSVLGVAVCGRTRPITLNFLFHDCQQLDPCVLVRVAAINNIAKMISVWNPSMLMRVIAYGKEVENNQCYAPMYTSRANEFDFKYQPLAKTCLDSFPTLTSAVAQTVIDPLTQYSTHYFGTNLNILFTSSAGLPQNPLVNNSSMPDDCEASPIKTKPLLKYLEEYDAYLIVLTCDQSSYYPWLNYTSALEPRASVTVDLNRDIDYITSFGQFLAFFLCDFLADSPYEPTTSKSFNPDQLNDRFAQHGSPFLHLVETSDGKFRWRHEYIEPILKADGSDFYYDFESSDDDDISAINQKIGENNLQLLTDHNVQNHRSYTSDVYNKKIGIKDYQIMMFPYLNNTNNVTVPQNSFDSSSHQATMLTSIGPAVQTTLAEDVATDSFFADSETDQDTLGENIARDSIPAELGIQQAVSPDYLTRDPLPANFETVPLGGNITLIPIPTDFENLYRTDGDGILPTDVPLDVSDKKTQSSTASPTIEDTYKSSRTPFTTAFKIETSFSSSAPVGLETLNDTTMYNLSNSTVSISETTVTTNAATTTAVSSRTSSSWNEQTSISTAYGSETVLTNGFNGQQNGEGLEGTTQRALRTKIGTSSTKTTIDVPTSLSGSILRAINNGGWTTSTSTRSLPVASSSGTGDKRGVTSKAKIVAAAVGATVAALAILIAAQHSAAMSVAEIPQSFDALGISATDVVIERDVAATITLD